MSQNVIPYQSDVTGKMQCQFRNDIELFIVPNERVGSCQIETGYSKHAPMTATFCTVLSCQLSITSTIYQIPIPFSNGKYRQLRRLQTILALKVFALYHTIH